jgi:PAS domain S-box-containing protein
MAHEDVSAPLRILLVEDSEHDAVVFRRALRKASAPCHIALCERAEEALEQLSQPASSFDLVVADYRLPGMSGLELFRELRANNIPIPFVLLTGAGAEYLAVEALKARVDDYIIKDTSRGYIDLLPLVLPDVVQRYRDSLEHQRTQNALHERESQLRLVTDALPVGISYMDLDQRYRFANRTCEVWVGQPRTALYGKHVQEVWGEEAYTRIRAYIEAALAGQPCACEYEMSLAQMRKRMLHLMCIPDLDTEGHCRGCFTLITDVTDRKRLETELRQAQTMHAIGTLAGGIAHEFNNILMAILGYTSLVLDDVPPQDSIAWSNAQQVRMAGERARDLVQQILAFSRQAKVEHMPRKLHLLVQEALGLIRRTLPATILLQQDVEKDVGIVLTSITEVHQIILNLCANAVHAMREAGGILDIRLVTTEVQGPPTSQHPVLRPGSYAWLSIRDTGHGMPPDVIEHIFEPFFTTKGVGEGTGMGLAVVHGIVTHHGGAVTVHSTPGQGTTFDIYLPRVAETATTMAVQPEPIVPGKGRVLYVDDDISLAHLGQAMLTPLGYKVVACTSGYEALQIFLQTPQSFDRVITDQTMPYMTGETFVRALRRIRPDIPIILCTGYSSSIDADKARAQGIEAFLMKPLSIDTLAPTIQRLLGRRDMSPS